jgi:hypothetical protein
MGHSRQGDDRPMSARWVTVSGMVVRGHRVASQKSQHYPRGTIEMQVPFFKELGLDLAAFYWATLNVSISPHTFAMKAPQYTFRGVAWTTKHPPEDFSFSRCYILFGGVRYEGWVYYPHPETKKRHFQDPTIVEILAPHITGIEYGAQVGIELNTDEVSVGQAIG